MSYNTTEALAARGKHIITVMCITKDFNEMSNVLASNIEALHDDNPALVGADHFVSHFKAILEKVPSFTYEIHDVIAQLDAKGGGKVWVYATLSGLPGGAKKDTVDMMDIDADGKLLKTKDVQRLLGA